MIWKIFGAFLKTGFLGFGGGAAIAPAMYKEAVERNHWVDGATFNEILALSNSLPGPAAPQMAAIIGYKAAGLAGAVVAVSAMVVPMAFLVVWVISWVFSAVGESSDKLVLLKKSTVAIFPLVSAMLCTLMAKFYRQGSSSIGRGRTVIFSALCLALLAAGVDNGFVILAMISLAVTASAPWPGWTKNVMAVPVALFLMIHSDLPSRLGFPFPSWLDWSLVAFLLLAGAWGLWVTPPLEGDGSGEKSGLPSVLRDLAWLWGAVLLFVLPLFAASSLLRAPAFLGLVAGMVFTGLMTFGGGPVFIPLAIGLLAGPSSQVFLYSKERLMQYIAIVNALPSPIITKISALSGWDMVHVLGGAATTGGGVAPIEAATSGLELSLWGAAGGSILVLSMVLPAVTNALAAFACLDGIKRSPGMKAVTKFILPVLMAIFLSVFVSFMETAFSTVASMPGHTTLSAALQCLGLFSVFLWFQGGRIKIPDPLLILGALIYGISVL